LKNSVFTVNENVIFEAAYTDSQSLSDFARADSIPWWWDHDLFFLNTDGLTVGRYGQFSFRFVPGGADDMWAKFIIHDEAGNYTAGESMNWDGVVAFLRALEDIPNGIPTSLSLLKSDLFASVVMHPVEFDSFRDFPVSSVAVANDDQRIDLQFRFPNSLALVDTAIVETRGGYRLELRVNQVGNANYDTAWRLIPETYELPTGIVIFDAETERLLAWSWVEETLPQLIETRLIPDLIESARQFATQNGLSHPLEWTEAIFD